MNVLFVSVRDAAGSQIARALHEREGGSARSAGTEPAEEVDGAVVEVLEEVGIDVSRRRPARLAGADLAWADRVVTIGGGDCARLPGKRYEDWSVPDPAGLCLEEARDLRAVIERRVSRLR